jgi:hypothetical protein
MMSGPVEPPPADDTAVRLALFRFFLRAGRPPVSAELAGEFGVPRREVEEALRRLADAHVIVLAPGTASVWMANPLSAVPTSFQAEVDGRRWYGNCIWDALGIVAMLGGAGTVHTWCPDCDEPLSVSIDHGQLVRTETVASFAIPAAQWWADIGAA